MSDEKGATMSIEMITELVERYERALLRELAALRYVERRRSEILATAVIDGKNPEARKRQTDQALSDGDYQAALSSADSDTVIRKTIDVEIGLTKAWLYSQSGR